MIKEGQKIRKIRELRGYKQEYIADQLGISAKSYGRLESGETALSISRLKQIAKVLDVDPVDVLSFDEKQIFYSCTQSGNGSAAGNGILFITKVLPENASFMNERLIIWRRRLNFCRS